MKRWWGLHSWGKDKSSQDRQTACLKGDGAILDDPEAGKPGHESAFLSKVTGGGNRKVGSKFETMTTVPC